MSIMPNSAPLPQMATTKKERTMRKMLKIIKTQNGELLNYDKIIEISLAEGEGLNESKETLTLYGVISFDVLGKERSLALYDTFAEAESAMELLTFWLASSSEIMFEMPDDNSEGGATENV